jgi:3-oxoacyl-[acyl-carrier-protein] synthase-1
VLHRHDRLIMGEISITALGMATPLAPTLPDSCAAFRANIRRASHLNTVDPCEDAALCREPIAACRAAYIAEGYCSGAKVVLLGAIALSDLLRRRPLDSGSRIGLALHLSDCSLLDAVSEPPDETHLLPSAQWRQRCASLVPRMLASCRLTIAPEHRHLSFGAHAGFVAALKTGATMVAESEVDRCLVGAVDSCLDPEFLLAAAVKGVLKTAVNPVGFVPGEAAAFALLERTADARGTAAHPIASLVCGPLVPGTFDRFSDQPPDGSVLARAIRSLLATEAGRADVGLVIGDLNGDEYRARNWGGALPRVHSRSVANAPMWIPALGFGETGSAAGAVGLCLAARAIERGHSRTAALAWLSDDSGAAAALMVAPAEQA